VFNADQLRDILYRITLTKIMLFTHYVIIFIHPWVLGLFAKLRKATISFVITVCLSAWELLGGTDFHEN